MKFLVLLLLCAVLHVTEGGMVLNNQVNYVDDVNLDNPVKSAVSPDGKNIYIAGFDSSTIVYYDRNDVDGTLSNQVVIEDAVNLIKPSSITVSADGRNVYAVAYTSRSLVAWDRSLADGSLSNQINHDLLEGMDGMKFLGPQFVVVSPDNLNVYIIADIEGKMMSFDRNPADGTLSNKLIINDPALRGIKSIALSPDTLTLYAIMGNFDLKVHGGGFTMDSSIVMWTRARADGSLSDQSRVNISGYCVDIAISSDGKHVYIVNGYDKAVVKYERDLNTGNVTNPKSFIDLDNLKGAVSLTISSDGQNIYALGSSSKAIVQYDRDPITGDLSQSFVVVDEVNLNGANDVLVTVDNYVYVTNRYSNSIVKFDRVAATIAPTTNPTFVVASSTRLYTYFSRKVDFAMATEECRSRNLTIAAAFSAQDIVAMRQSVGSSVDGVWVGLNDLATEGQYLWHGFEHIELYYDDFFRVDNVAGKDCIEMPSGGWAAADCSALRPFVCMNEPRCAEGESLSSATDSCATCPAGSYCPGNDDAVECLAGHYCASEGLEAPTPCSMGTANANRGSSSSLDCLRCPAGSYGSDQGRATCELCPVDTSSKAVGATDASVCRPCSLGSAPLPGASVCVVNGANGCLDAQVFNYSVGSCDARNKRVIHYTSLEPDVCSVEVDYVDMNCSYIPLGSSFGLIIAAFLAASIVVHLMVLRLLVKYRGNRLVKATQVNLSLFFVLSAVLINASVFTFLGTPNDLLCSLRPACTTLSLTLFTSILLSKTRHVYAIFVNKTFTKYKNQDAYMAVFLCLGINVAILAIWFIAEAPRRSEQRSDHNMDPRYCVAPGCVAPTEIVCSNTDGIFLRIYVALYLLLITYCCVIAFKARKLPSSFTEANNIMFSTYNIAIIAIMILLVYSVTDLEVAHITLLVAFGSFWITVSTVGSIYVPKLHLVRTMTDDELRTLMSTDLNRFLEDSSTALKPAASSGGGSSVVFTGSDATATTSKSASRV